MNRSLRPLLIGGDGGATPIADAGLLLIRIVAGISLAFGHGLGKMPPSEGFIETTAGLGFPAPLFFAWAAGFAEFFGGILIALGLITRPASFLVAFTMAIAVFIRHGDDPFTSKEKAMLYFVIAGMLMLTGSGRFGFDRFFRRPDGRIWR